MTKSNKGLKFEKQVQRSIGSGKYWHAPLDINYQDHCIESKYTDNKGYRINLALLEKVWGEALSMNKEPMLIVGIKRNDNQVFTLYCQIQLEKKEN